MSTKRTPTWVPFFATLLFVIALDDLLTDTDTVSRVLSGFVVLLAGPAAVGGFISVWRQRSKKESSE